MKKCKGFRSFDAEPVSVKKKQAAPHIDSLQSLVMKVESSKSSIKAEPFSKPKHVATITPELFGLSDHEEVVATSKLLLSRLLSFCSHWIPIPAAAKRRHDRELSSSSVISQLFIFPTPPHVLNAKPVINIDAKLKNRTEFTSIYGVMMYDYFNENEIDYRLHNLDYLSAQRGMQKGTGQLKVQVFTGTAPSKNTAVTTDKQKQSRVTPAPYIITGQVRSLLVEMIIVHARFASALPETLHLAVNMMDRFLSLQMIENEEDRVKPSNLLGMGIAALMIALKYEESKKPQAMLWQSVSAVFGWSQVCNSNPAPMKVEVNRASLRSCSSSNSSNRLAKIRLPSFLSPSELTATTNLHDTEHLQFQPNFTMKSNEKRQVVAGILKMEKELLHALDWEIRVATVPTFLKRYMLASEMLPEHCLVATCLADRTLLEYTLLKFTPSLLAASIVSLVRLLFRLDGWSSTLEYYSGYKQDELKNSITTLQSKLVEEEISLFQHAAAVQHRNTIDEQNTTDRSADTRRGKRKLADNIQSITSTVMTLPSQATVQSDSQYVPGTSIRIKYKDRVYRSIINLPVQWVSDTDTQQQKNASSKSSASHTSSWSSTVSSLW